MPVIVTYQGLFGSVQSPCPYTCTVLIDIPH